MSVDHVRDELNAVIALVGEGEAEMAYAFLLGRWDQAQTLASAVLSGLHVPGVDVFHNSVQAGMNALEASWNTDPLTAARDTILANL